MPRANLSPKTLSIDPSLRGGVSLYIEKKAPIFPRTGCGSPSPPNGERAGVRGEMVRLASSLERRFMESVPYPALPNSEMLADTSVPCIEPFLKYLFRVRFFCVF